MYRGAIIGLGNIGLNGHLKAYLNPDMMKKFQIVAGCDCVGENIEKFKKMSPQSNAYSDINELLTNEKLDFVDICTPPLSHFEIIARAVEKKINIICEKPVDINFESLLRIKEKLAKSNLVFLPGHQYRYSPVWQKVDFIINRGLIGKPFLMQFFVYRTGINKGNDAWNPVWRSEIENSGGGIIVDHGSHLFYLASSILGVPKHITAQTERLYHFEYTVEDTAWINIKYEKGIAQFALTWAGKEKETIFKILGTDGDISVTENEIVLNTFGKKEKIILNEGMSSDSSHSDWYLGLFNKFYSRLKNKDFSPDGIDEAIINAMCMSAAYKSAEINKTVALEFSEID
ncbi:MAG: Gfo/Idh/MocA family oxidoreductase [bacterium]|nr:Gfo/Idh/MocA family oxidoreductase [bacterium]